MAAQLEHTNPDLGWDEGVCVQSSVYSSDGDECRLPDCDYEWRLVAQLSIMEESQGLGVWIRGWNLEILR